MNGWMRKLPIWARIVGSFIVVMVLVIYGADRGHDEMDVHLR